jgi:tetratricopeptide (TPR) repeat protein
MDLLLEKRTDDVDSRVVITDLFFYNLGDWMSAAMAENMKRSGMMDLDDIDDESQENIETIERITDLYNEGRIDAAEEMWEELPQDLRGSKSILVSRLMNLPGHDSAAYVKARAEFEENYPNDEATMSLDVNTSFANFDYESAYAAVQRMKPLLGGIDGYQYYLHAYALMGLDRNAEALEMAEKAVELEPGLPFIREMLLDCLIAAGKYERAVEELQLLMDLEFVTTAEIGMSDEKFYESAAFVEFRKKDPETWSFLDEEYDDEDWGDEVWEDE